MKQGPLRFGEVRRQRNEPSKVSMFLGPMGLDPYWPNSCSAMHCISGDELGRRSYVSNTIINPATGDFWEEIEGSTG